MGEKRYIISYASKLIEVESHVLRYWEDELDVNIPRNEMGHRYYTDFYIDLFKRIKELKDGGFQLKAIKLLIPELMSMNTKENESVEILRDELFCKFTDESIEKISVENEMNNSVKNEMNISMENIENNHSIKEKSNELMSNETINDEKQMSVNGNKLQQFQAIISEVVSNALKENTGTLGKEVSEIVSDNVIKEMDYLMHIREKQEEERFKKLDESIRNCQISVKERAKSRRRTFLKKKRP